MGIEKTKKRITDTNQATIDKFKSKVVVIHYSQSPPSPKNIDKKVIWDKAKEVGKNPIADDTTPSRALPAAS